MPKNEQRIEKLKSVLKLIDESVSREEFTEAFKALTAYLKKIEAGNNTKISAIREELLELSKQLNGSTTTSFADLKKEALAAIAKAMTEQENTLNFLRDKARSLENGRDGNTGPKGDKGDSGPQGPAGSVDTGDEIVGKINTAEKQIVLAAVEGLEDLKTEVKQISLRPTGRVGGAKGFTLYVNGVKKLLTAQTINITGSGVSYAYANGRNDITITGGSGSLSVLAATGTVDDSNKTFTFASEPTLVIVNGATYRHQHGVTISTTTATLDNPVGTGGDIYGLG